MKIIEPTVELIDDVNTADVYSKLERCGRVSHQSEARDAEQFIRRIIALGHESVLEHVSLTFHIICDRAIQNELVRHRHASFTVESTRYVKYDELEVIAPPLENVHREMHFKDCVGAAEDIYSRWLRLGVAPEQARAVLPLCLKSELYMTANLREWRHIIKLRTAEAAHPQMRLIIGQVRDILAYKLPVIVEDLK